MNKRHVFLLAVISMICQVTMADGYTDLYILPADASLPMENITLTNISNITFNNGQMNIMTTDSNVKTYQLSQVHKLMLTLPTKIEKTTTAGDSEMIVYTLTGCKVLQGKGISLTSLPKGVYIIKDGNTTRKFTNR